MDKFHFRLVSLTALLIASPTIAHAFNDGFILKSGEGEVLQNGNVVKASPKTGTESAILVEQTFQRDGKTVSHYHDQGDELFYVVSGAGLVLMSGDYHPISKGDVIFVPRSAIHQIKNADQDEPLVVVFFMSTPELVEQFRAIHERKTADPERPLTDEVIAQIEKAIGGGYTVKLPSE